MSRVLFQFAAGQAWGILAVAVALSLGMVSSSTAKEVPNPVGSYTLITNQVYDRGDQTGLKAGSVTVRWYPASGTLLFDSVEEVNGWIADVKQSGGTSGGNRVVVVFDQPELGGSVKFMMEPGKLDIR
ncbi:MAG: hypothetical protein KDA88_22925 [Planctomycetaceae bacterium]|nr:hypothetical protein [Planctomycetaceae bacterium]MCB9951628.1 hypothetical protein [Planctomycetaceae bacterium]